MRRSQRFHLLTATLGLALGLRAVSPQPAFADEPNSSTAHAAPSSTTPSASSRPASRTLFRETAETVTSDVGDQAGFLSVAPMQVAGDREPARYTGRRIDIDLRDADIHNVLRLLAEVGNVNIVTGDDVGGLVTIRMRNVPWDQALDVILVSRGLGLQRQGNIFRVAPQSTLDKELELTLERQRNVDNLRPLETRIIPVSYGIATNLSARARELLSGRGTISVDDRTNVMIARDAAENLDQVERLVRSLDTQTPQVLVEARIVEATSTYSRDIGVQWGGDGVATAATGNPTGIVFPSNITLAGGASDGQTPTRGLAPTSPTFPNSNFAVNLPAAVGTGSGGAIGLTLGSVTGAVNINVRLSAAETSGQLRIVSSPRILTLDNVEASIVQSTMIPYSQVSAAGVQTAFQEARLQLRVKPHVTSDGSVHLRVAVNRDEPDFNNTGARGDPTILRRQADTELLIPDGRTAVLGGIYTRNTGRSLDGVPGLADVPVLGALFSHRRNSDRRTEMLIFLTPRVVNRAEALGR